MSSNVVSAMLSESFRPVYHVYTHPNLYYFYVPDNGTLKLLGVFTPVQYENLDYNPDEVVEAIKEVLAIKSSNTFSIDP